MKSLPIEQYLKLFKPETLANINSYAGIGEWPKNYECVAMDMGGTNFRIGRVKFDAEGNPSVYDFKKQTMPGAEREITIDEFYDFFEAKKKEYSAEDVALCFSYEAEIFPDLSAKITHFSKEVKVDGAEGKIIKARIVNDTTAALLGTKGANIGLILGTGFNIAFIKDGVIYNSECGRFVGFPVSEIDCGPLSEMQLSGVYINPLIKNNPELRSEIIDRAAKIAAAEIYGTAKYAGIEELKIAAEGSVFYNFDELREKIIFYLNQLGCKYEFLDGRDKTLIGAAVAAYAFNK